MTPPPKDLTDTGRQHAIAEEAAERAVERAQRTQGPVLDAEVVAKVYDISEKVVARERPSHFRECENHPAGPACKLGKRIDDIEEGIRKMQLERAGEAGENRIMAREAGKTAALRTAAISAALSLAVGLGLFVVNRAWPARATAQTTFNSTSTVNK